jgi:DNA-binding NarL/FixJ family response regulator
VKPRIIIADDHRILRDGIAAQLGVEGRYEVVAQAADGLEAVALCKQYHPDVIIMDLGMPQLNGIEATRQVIEVCGGTKVLALSMHSEQRYVADALQAGVAGYVLKDAAFEELERALETVLSGGVYLSPGIQAAVIDHALGRGPGLRGATSKELTAREREILQMVAEGLTAKQIASTLHLSVKTVETHRRQVMDKTGANSVADLVRYAIREGIATLDQ